MNSEEQKREEVKENRGGIMKKLFINNKEVKGIGFVYDGCHKIYILEDMNDYKKVCKVWGEGEPIYSLEDLEDCYNNSCPLRFISNWKLDVYYVKQCEYAIFEWKEI